MQDVPQLGKINAGVRFAVLPRVIRHVNDDQRLPVLLCQSLLLLKACLIIRPGSQPDDFYKDFFSSDDKPEVGAQV